MTPLIGTLGGLFAMLISTAATAVMLASARKQQNEASQLLFIAVHDQPATSAPAKDLSLRSPAIYLSEKDFKFYCPDINHCQVSPQKILQSSSVRA